MKAGWEGVRAWWGRQPWSFKFAIGLALGVVIIVSAGSVLTGSDDDEQPADPAEELDDDAVDIACRRFVSLATDYSDGVLTSSEVRDRVQSIDSVAPAGPPRLVTASRDLLAAFTTGDEAEQAAAVETFGTLCEEAGF